MIAEGRVGVQLGGDGSIQPVRFGRTGEQLVGSAHGDFYEAVSRQSVFTISNAVAGVAPGTVLSTTPPLALWNPTASGVNLAIIKAVIGYVSGTLGAGSIVFAYVASQPSSPTGGTAITGVSNLLGSTKVSVGKGFTGATLASTPLILRPLAIVGAALGTTATFPATAETVNDGAIVIAPGGVLCIQGVAAAGTTPLVILSMVFEEIPIIGS